AAINELKAMFGDSPGVRWWAAVALSSIQPDLELVPILIDALQAENAADIRPNVAEALGRLGSLAEDALPKLQGLLEDGSRNVRIQAYHAIRRIKGEEM